MCGRAVPATVVTHRVRRKVADGRSEAMENGWQFAQATRRHRVRRALARALVALAEALAPAMHQSPAA